MDRDTHPAPPQARLALGADFWRFFAGQTVSNLGSSVTFFALPLIIYDLTGSALNLGITTAAEFLPFLLFGLPIGAWVDRVDRKRLMIVTDLASMAVIFAIPLLSWVGLLRPEHVYAVAFLSSTLRIASDSAQFAAIPSLVSADDLITANGRIQASFAAATVAGPPLAGLLVGVVSIESVLVIDAASFAVSALALGLIRRGFGGGTPREAGASIRRDVFEGLRYVFGHPVLRSISIMMAIINTVGTTVFAQLVLFAKERLGAGDGQIALLFSAGSVGTILLGLAAGPLRARFKFAPVALGALLLNGVAIVGLAATPWFWLALPLQALIGGSGVLFNVNTGSLRQSIVPNALLGRIMSVAMVLASSGNVFGALVGAWAIERTGDVRLVYAAIGLITCLVAGGFWLLSPLGHAERYLPQPDERPAAAPTDAARSIA